MPGAPKEKNFEVIPSAWPAVSMFVRLQTQWRTTSGMLVGLDYQAVQWMFELWNVQNPRQLLDDLQVIEGKVIAMMNKRKK